MSEVLSGTASFADLFAAGKVDAGAIDDFVGTWHDSGPEDTREMHEFLGFTWPEWVIYAADRRLLSDIIDARRTGRTFRDIVTSQIACLEAKEYPRSAARLLTLNALLDDPAIVPE